MVFERREVARLNEGCAFDQIEHISLGEANQAADEHSTQLASVH